MLYAKLVVFTTIQKKQMQAIKNKLNNFIISFKIRFFNKWGQNSFYLGFQRACIIPTLPLSVENYLNHIFVRIFRVIGGIFFLLLVTKSDFYLQLPHIFHLFFSIIASIHVTQVLIIFIIKIIYSTHTLIYKRKNLK